MELAFRDICVTINDKDVLYNVSGRAESGQLLAIMGPSGAGKTTLLNVISGRQPIDSGQILVDGTTLNKKLKRKICYVLQQDNFFPSLTLKDTLAFAANLRLPDEMKHAEKMKRMNEIINILDLRKCCSTIIGDMWMPGLSGGEKKRANIACEIMTDPSTIVLDEPTTGLDSTTAMNLVTNLRGYAEKHNKTIVMSIHQPSTQLFFQFDKLLLLSDGKMGYYGQTDDVIEYFENISIPIPESYNPADFILEKLKENDETKRKIISAANEMRDWSSYQPYSENTTMVDKSESHSANDGRPDGELHAVGEIRKRFHNPFRKNVSDADNDPDNVHVSLLDVSKPGRVDIEDNRKWPTGFWTQYSQLTLRTFKQSSSRILDRMKLLENFLICSIVSLIWFQLPRTEETLRDRMGAIFFIAVHWAFVPLFDAVASFPTERVVINKERAAGWYRLSAYYLAKMTSELPLIIVQPAIFVIIAYWCIGLNGPEAFSITLGTVFIDSVAGQSFGLFIGILCMDVGQSMTIAILCQMAIMLLGGLFTRTLPMWLDWLKYFSFVHYSFHCLFHLEFTDAPPIQCSANRNATKFPICNAENSTVIPSDLVLDFYDAKLSYWQYLLPLLFFILLFRSLGYIVLRFVHVPR